QRTQRLMRAIHERNASYIGVVFFFQAEDGIRDRNVTGVQTCALPIWVAVTQPIHRKKHQRIHKKMYKKMYKRMQQLKQQKGYKMDHTVLKTLTLGKQVGKKL